MQQCGRSVIHGACSKRTCLLQHQGLTQFLAGETSCKSITITESSIGFTIEEVLSATLLTR
jgi:hypothetical protein